MRPSTVLNGQLKKLNAIDVGDGWPASWSSDWGTGEGWESGKWGSDTAEATPSVDLT